MAFSGRNWRSGALSAEDVPMYALPAPAIMCRIIPLSLGTGDAEAGIHACFPDLPERQAGIIQGRHRALGWLEDTSTSSSMT